MLYDIVLKIFYFKLHVAIIVYLNYSYNKDQSKKFGFIICELCGQGVYASGCLRYKVQKNILHGERARLFFSDDFRFK